MIVFFVLGVVFVVGFKRNEEKASYAAYSINNAIFHFGGIYGGERMK